MYINKFSTWQEALGRKIVSGLNEESEDDDMDKDLLVNTPQMWFRSILFSLLGSIYYELGRLRRWLRQGEWNRKE